MITSTKSVKTILIYHIAGSACCAIWGVAYGASSIGSELALHPVNNNPGFVFGYIFVWPLVFGLWIWANCYALNKLNKLRDEASALRHQEGK